MSPSVHLTDHTLTQIWHMTFCLIPQATLHRMMPWKWISIPAHHHLESMITWTVHLMPKDIHHKCGVSTTNRCGAPLPPGTPSPHESDRGQGDWTPYSDRVQFQTADFLFCWNQMSAGDINIIAGLWSASLAPHHDSPPFESAKELYNTIDLTPLGDIPW